MILQLGTLGLHRSLSIRMDSDDIKCDMEN